MILALGSAADSTFVYFLERLRQATAGTHRRVVAVDVVQVARSGSFLWDPREPTAGSLRVGNVDLVWGDVSAVWIRLPELASGAPDESGRRLVNSVHRALATLVHQVAERVPVVNPPLAEPSNTSKVAHLLSLAHRTGLRVPASCLTNDPALAAAFVAEHHGDVIYKGASSAKTWVRRWDEATDADRLPLITSTPALFQRRVDGPDVRVHVAAEDLHAELIECPQVDYRLAPVGTVFAPTSVPDRIATACRTLAVDLDAPLLGVDFKIERSTGEWFLLEANGMPCFEGYDVRAGGAISASLVRYLASDQVPRPSSSGVGGDVVLDGPGVAGHAHDPQR